MKVIQMDVFCIHLPHRKDRLMNIRKLERFYPSLNIQVIEGIRHERGLTGCMMSHQKIVRMAKEEKRPYVWVLEDDCKLLPTNGKLVDQARTIVEYLRTNPDVGVVSGCGNLSEFTIDIVKSLRDMFFLRSSRVTTSHCVFYSEAWYDKVLSLDPNHGAIDEILNEQFNLRYTYPYLATQVASFSDIKKEDTNYQNILASNTFVTYTLKEEGLITQ